jgi:hypothetical protein
VAVIAGLAVDMAAPRLEFRHVGDHVDGTAGGVAAEQGALWSAQNFHPGHVVELDRGQVGRHRNLVLVNGNAVFTGTRDHQPADTTDTHARAAEVGGRVTHVWCVQLQIRRCDDLPIFHHRAGESRNGDRNFLKTLLGPLGGHDHFLDGRRADVRTGRNQAGQNKQACDNGRRAWTWRRHADDE